MKSLGRMTKFALTAIAVATASGASASTLLSFGVTGVGDYSVNTVNITAATANKTLPAMAFVSSCGPLSPTPVACSLAGMANGTAVNFLDTLTFNTSLVPFAPFRIAAGLLQFTFTNITNVLIVPSGANSNGSISQQFNGSVTVDPTGLFLGQTASISETCTQTSIGASITCSDSVLTPGLPTQVPEPTSLALLGAGLAAFGALRRRRQDRELSAT